MGRAGSSHGGAGSALLGTGGRPVGPGAQLFLAAPEIGPKRPRQPLPPPGGGSRGVVGNVRGVFLAFRHSWHPAQRRRTRQAAHASSGASACQRGKGRVSPPAGCRSSVVEHPLGKGEVVSSILTGSTI